jgi:hypothetical protein
MSTAMTAVQAPDEPFFAPMKYAATNANTLTNHAPQNSRSITPKNEDLFTKSLFYHLLNTG